MKENNAADILIELRKQHGYTQSALADQLGVSFQAVSKWERGENLPDAYTLVALADIYHITVDEILRGKIKDRDFLTKLQHRKFILFIVGMVILVLSPISIFLYGYNNYEEYIPVILIMAAIAIPLIIYANISTADLGGGGTMKDLRQRRNAEIVYALCSVIFLALGFIWGLWHPGWLIFVLGYVVTLILRK